jgi:regulator of sigma E protease
MNPAFNLIWDIARTLIVVGVIIFVHELGHFLAAKRLKINVERFSIGFGPKMIGFRRGETEYSISWFPIFGGYVKMKGEYLSGDTKEEEVYEKGHFLAAPVSHRAIVALAGPFMNIVFAIVAIALAYMVGMPSNLVPSHNTTIGYVEQDSPASKSGIIPGDRIISVAGYKAKTWGDLQENIAINPDKEVELTLIRNETQEIRVIVKPERIKELILSIGTESQSELDNAILSEGMRKDFENNKVQVSQDAIVQVEEPGKKWLIIEGNKKYYVKKEENRLNIYKDTDFGKIGVSAASKPIIGTIEKGSSAEKLGYRTGDIVEEVNHVKVSHIIEFLDSLPKKSGEPVTLTIRRGNDKLEMPFSMEFDENNQPVSLNGISFGKIVRLNPIAAFGVAIPETIQIGGKIFQFLKRMITREVPMKYVAGPIGIVQLTMSVVKVGLAGILHFAGFLSVNLGIVNLLPLFISDGGMLVFLIIEKLRGKRLSQRKQLIIQQIGVGFIILLFLLVTYNDVLRLVKGSF